MEWEFFLFGSILKRVEDKIHEIANIAGLNGLAGSGLMSGDTGLACFYANYADWSRDHSFERLAAERIGRALDPAAGSFPGYSLANGFAGTGHVLRYLQKDKLLSLDGEAIYRALDEPMYKAMLAYLDAGKYDYLHGALGIGLYFLGEPGNEQYRGYLKLLSLRLLEMAEQEDDGSLKWISVLDPDTERRGVNLSLSHGMASIILVACRILEEGIAEEQCRTIILGGLRYLEKQRLENEQFLSIFPSWALESEQEVQSSRLAWCYGDLGIGLAYLAAGRLFPDQHYSMRGLEILQHSAERRDLEENRVVDACLCHGASGIALIFNIIYQQTKYTLFRDASLYWLDVCLNMAVHEDGAAGYKYKGGPGRGHWLYFNGLLTGTAGIGLALLSFVQNRKPEWAKLFLLNL